MYHYTPTQIDYRVVLHIHVLRLTEYTCTCTQANRVSCTCTQANRVYMYMYMCITVISVNTILYLYMLCITEQPENILYCIL